MTLLTNDTHDTPLMMAANEKMHVNRKKLCMQTKKVGDLFVDRNANVVSLQRERKRREV